jgi:hypothetical protein
MSQAAGGGAVSENAEAAIRNDAKRDRASFTRRFFASELPWCLIIVYVAWVLILGPAFVKAGDSMAIHVHVRNDSAEPVFIVTAAPRFRDVVSLTLKPGEDRRVRVAGGDGPNFWDQTVTVTAYADDGSIAKRWRVPRLSFPLRAERSRARHRAL